jgi:hypothetical protein
MFDRPSRRALYAACIVAFAFALALNLIGPRAQTIDDINLVPGNTIDVEDLLELLATENPGFPIQDLLFLLGSTWKATLSTIPTPTVGPTGIPTPSGPTPTMQPGGNTFDLQDFFVTTEGSNWHYAGFNGGSTDDNYTYTVEDTLQNVGIVQMASRFRTDTDEPEDDRNGDVDFYLIEDGSKGTGGALGDLFFFGLFKADGFGVGLNTVIASDPIRLGGDGLQIGDEVVDTGAASSSLGSIDLTATVRYVEFLSSFDTPLGTFTNVLKMEIDISGVLHTFFDVPFEVFDNAVFLKMGVGIVAVDQTPDPNDAELLGIDAGTVYVNGNPVTIMAN